MGGGASSSGGGSKTNLSPSEMLDTYNKALPISLSTIMNQASQGTNSLANAATLNNPIFTAGTLDQLGQYGGAYQQAGSEIAQGQAQGQADLLSGAGTNAANAAQGLNQKINKNYYDIMNPASRQATNLVNSVSLNGLSNGEANSVERSLNNTANQTGNLGLNNATNTVSNAVNFGGAFNQKQGILGNALNTATNVAGGALNQGFNPVDVATNAGNANSNFGLSQSNPSQANQFVTTPVNTAIGFGSQLTGNTNATKSGSQSSSANGGICCFIFLEMYHGDMPSYIRKCRDRYYTFMPDVAVGYKKMAEWLVPLMKRSSVVRSLVWHFMVKPLTNYGAFVTRRSSERSGKWARKFWFTLWTYLAR